MTGYYLPKFNWSVRHHNGQWCLFTRLPSDQVATTPDQILAVQLWADSNRQKFTVMPPEPLSDELRQRLLAVLRRSGP